MATEVEKEGPGYGVWGTGYGVPGFGKNGVWKIPDVENMGCRKQGIWCKTRGLSEKHGGIIISPNIEFSLLKWEVEILLFQIAMKINRRETRFSIIKQIKHFGNKKTIQMPTCRAVIFFYMGCLMFFAMTCVDIFPPKMIVKY